MRSQFFIDPTEWYASTRGPTVSDETHAARCKVFSTINECLGKQNSPSTISNYESILSKEVGDAEKYLATTLLLLDTEFKFLSLFAFVRYKNADLKWSRVRSLKSALAKYHSRKKLKSVLDEWTPPMAAMWAGLSRMANHDTKGNEPIDFETAWIT